MMRCHDCRTLMLDRAYGLLDEAEDAAVQAHLAECDACRAAGAEADRARGLIARAAKSTFPNVAFVPPADEPVVPFTPARKAKSSWMQWAVAASVLAMIPGALVPLNKLADRFESAKLGVSDSSERAARAKLEYERNLADTTALVQHTAAKQKHLAVVSSWANDAKAEAARKVNVAVTKPQSIAPGAPNEYVIAVADPADSLAGSRVEAQFRDETGQVLHVQPVQPKADTTVRLPAEIWTRVKPQTELMLSVSSVNAVSGARTELLEPIRLFGPVYATMLTTDKLAYRPGEQIHFRSLTLDRITLRPPTREQNLKFTLRKADGAGKTLELTGSTNLVKDAAGTLTPMLDANGQPIRGVGCGSFLLPADAPEGEYLLTLAERSGANGSPPAMAFPTVKSIQVRAGGPEKFTKAITFTAPSHSANQLVVALVELKLGDKPVAGAKGAIALSVDGVPFSGVIKPVPQARNADGNPIMLTGQTDATGRFRVEFKLPPGSDIKLGVTFDDKGGNESVTERVPVAGKELTIEFFPEGGTLIAGVPNRVYVRGTNLNGKPLDVRGTVNLGREIVAKVEASGPSDEPGVHRGVGSFTFTPKSGEQYQLHLQHIGREVEPFNLPKAEAGGVTFTALDTVVKPGQPIRVRVHSSGKDRKLVVGAYTRGRLADKQSVLVKADAPAVVTLLAQSDARGGVTRITVFEDMAGSNDLVPVAERLVFRHPGEVLNLSVTPTIADRAVDLAIAATDEKGNPIPAILWAAAVNAAVAPDGKHRAIPAHFLLAGEVQTPDDLEYADFLLTDHPKAAESLDGVLATQGWRRFVEQKHSAAPGTAADALLKLHGKQRSKDGGSSLAEKYWRQFDGSTAETDAAKAKKDAAEPVMLKLYAEYESSRRATEEMAIAVQNAAGPYEQLRGRLAFASGCVAVLCVMLGALAAARRMGPGGILPYVVGAIAATGLTAYLWFDASARPATIPTVNSEKIRPPQASPDAPLPEVTLPAPKTVEAVRSGEPFKIFGIGSSKLIGSSGLESFNRLSNLPMALPKMPFRPAPGKTVLDTILAAEEAGRVKAEALAKERALARLRKLESALVENGLAKDPIADRLRESVSQDRPLVVREYAALRPATDEDDTVMWKPIIVLPADGRTKLQFQLGSAPGGYQVIVAGHSPDGRLGSTKSHIPSK